MKCLNCGCELEEGKLYCSKCGYEIQIVPDFEPEIEETMNDAMNEALEDIANHLIQNEEEKRKEEQLEQEEKQHNRIRIYSTVAAICTIVLVMACVLFYNHMGTVETQLAKAEKAAQKGNYTKAIEYTLRAVEINGSDMETRNMLGTYYLQNNQQKNAITTTISVSPGAGGYCMARSPLGQSNVTKRYPSVPTRDVPKRDGRLVLGRVRIGKRRKLRNERECD